MTGGRQATPGGVPADPPSFASDRGRYEAAIS